MPVLEIVYTCKSCHQESSPENKGMICEYCGGSLKGEGFPGVTGTRDNFGFKNQFNDDVTGERIDNFKSWEKAGYRNPLDVVRNHDVKEKIKMKVEKIRKGLT